MHMCVPVLFCLMGSYIFHMLFFLLIFPQTLYLYPTDNEIFFLSIKMHIHLTKDMPSEN